MDVKSHDETTEIEDLALEVINLKV